MKPTFKCPAVTVLLLLCGFMMTMTTVMVASAGTPGTDEADDDRFVVVRAGLVLPVEGEPIKNGIIVIRNGVIDAIGSNVEYPRKAKIIHAEELVVVPGLINPCSQAGHKTYYRTGVHADLKASDGFRLDPDAAADLLQCGFTTLGVLPPGTGFPGQAMAYEPRGSCPETRTLNDSAYILATMTQPSREKKSFKQAFDTAQKEIEKVEKARKDWEEKQKKAKEEQAKKEKEGKAPEKKPAPAPDKPKDSGTPEKKGPEKADKPEVKKDNDKGTPDKKEEKAKEEKFVPPEINPPYRPLVDLIQKSEGARLLVSLDQASDFIHLKEVAEKLEIEKAYLLRASSRRRSFSSSTDLTHVVEEIGKEKAQVVMAPVIQRRAHTADRINLPAAFVKAGAEVSFVPVNDRLDEHAAYLKRIGMLVKAGLDPDAALKAATLNPARLLGVGDRVGSIEAGKDGNLLFLTGKPFNTLTRIEKVMIRGEVVAKGKALQ